MALLGAGCAKPNESPNAKNENNQKPAENIPAVSDMNELPAITPSATPIDDSAWKTTTTKTGVTLRAPIKGSYAPTWTYTLLANDDPHLKGDCYVTENTVYKRTTGFSFETACQTTTALNAGPSERTDYFVFHSYYEDSAGKQVAKNNLFTFTKKYPANFDMNAYSAVLEHIINIID